MDDEFRAAAKAEVSRLLSRWKTVEISIKQAEQISSEAQIPAINELRYASRQLFNAIVLIDKIDLSQDDKDKINKRITVADQYLYNAEHDIADSITTFYRQVITDVEARFGRNVVISHFPKYMIFREHVKECESLIARSRGDYETRGENYTTIRTNHVPHMIEFHDQMIEAQVSAEEERRRTQKEVIVAQGKLKISYFIMLALAIVASVEPAYFWGVSPESYCSAHKTTPILNILCR